MRNKTIVLLSSLSIGCFAIWVAIQNIEEEMYSSFQEAYLHRSRYQRRKYRLMGYWRQWRIKGVIEGVEGIGLRCPRHDRTTPEMWCKTRRRTHAPQQAGLFDQLVGAAAQRERHSQAERLGGLQVDDQLDLRGLLHRQVGGLLALEDATGVDAGQVGRVLPTATVARSWCGGSEQI